MIRKFFANKFALSLLVIALVSAAHVGGVLRPIESVVINSFGFVQKPARVVGEKISGFFNFLGNVQNLSKDNVSMSEEISRLMSENASLKEVRRENDMLRNQLKLSSQTKYQLDTALVIGKDPGNIANELTINKGASEGIKPDMPVIVSEGVLVGRVSEVFDHSARVLLITDTRSRVNAVEQQTRATGILRGQHGLGLVLDTVPQNEVLQEGGVIITSGLGGIFPNGLVVGKISDIQTSDNELFQQASIQPLFHLRELDLVFIITQL